VPISRFELFVVLRNQVGDRAMTKPALAVEAIAEQLARDIGHSVELAQLAGLGSGIDARLCLNNPTRRGEVAAQILRTEGAGDQVVQAVFSRREHEPEALSTLAALLVVAESLAEIALGLLEDTDDPTALEGAVIAAKLRRRGEVRGEPLAVRGLACLRVLGLDCDRAGDLAAVGIAAAAADLVG
jgi:predicted hydrolase (HD superfamily)